MMNPDYISTTHDHFRPKNVTTDMTNLYQPDWVRLDRHVLRFYGYFKEAVVESNVENYRIRKVSHDLFSSSSASILRITPYRSTRKSRRTLVSLRVSS
jgi:hypothetical protein